jgi:hypothetical protein
MTTNIRAQLTLDDMATATLNKLKSGFASLDKRVSDTTKSFLDFAKQTAATAIGVNIGSGFEMMKAALLGPAQAATNAEEQIRELSKTVAGMSTVSGGVEKLSTALTGTNKEVFALKRAAKGATETFASGAQNVYDRLSEIAQESGVARSELVATFAETGKNTTRTTDQLVMLIGNVSRAARALPAPVKDIVAGFSEIEKNTISASNPLIDMVKQANLFRGHNEQIATRLQAMGRQGMLNLMNKALKEMQERAKKMPMTLKEMGEQLGDMKTDVMRLIGEPMVAALTPAFRDLQKFISEHRGEIEQFARTAGEKVGEWAKDAANLMKEGFQYVQTHAGEIKQAITDAFQFAKDAIKWIIDHKEEIGVGMVASKAVSSGAVSGGVNAVQGVAAFARALSAANAAGIGPLGVGAAGAASSLGAFAVAIGFVLIALDQFRRYLSETKGYLSPSAGMAAENVESYRGRFAEVANDYEKFTDSQIKSFDQMEAKMLEEARVAGMNTDAIGKEIEAAWSHHRALRESTKGMTEARDAVARFQGIDVGALTADQMNQFREAQLAAGKGFADTFNSAVKSNNTAALNAAVQIVAGSKPLQDALLETGSVVGLSLEELAKVIGDKAGDFATKLRERAESDRAAGAKPPPTVMQFNGGQTFNIKQDFRDQDPDRIAVIFKTDIARAAESRLQAKTAQSFGG